MPSSVPRLLLLTTFAAIYGAMRSWWTAGWLSISGVEITLAMTLLAVIYCCMARTSVFCSGLIASTAAFVTAVAIIVEVGAGSGDTDFVRVDAKRAYYAVDIEVNAVGIAVITIAGFVVGSMTAFAARLCRIIAQDSSG